MAIKFHMKCVDDQTEWEHDKNVTTESEFLSHQNFVNGPYSGKDVEAAWMKCPTCNKNTGHEVTIVSIP